MKNKKGLPSITDKIILDKIYLIRGQKVMLDRDLAELYNVSTSNLNLAVKRNQGRFPNDFMFQLTKGEFEALMLQIATSNNVGRGGTRKLPYVFTEQGVAMLSGVLRSKVAIRMHIHIIRVFAKLKEMLLTNKDILIQLQQIESRVSSHDGEIQLIFQHLRQLLAPPQPPRRRIGFRRTNEGDSKQ